MQINGGEKKKRNIGHRHCESYPFCELHLVFLYMMVSISSSVIIISCVNETRKMKSEYPGFEMRRLGEGRGGQRGEDYRQGCGHIPPETALWAQGPGGGRDDNGIRAMILIPRDEACV